MRRGTARDGPRPVRKCGEKCSPGFATIIMNLLRKGHGGCDISLRLPAVPIRSRDHDRVSSAPCAQKAGCARIVNQPDSTMSFNWLQGRIAEGARTRCAVMGHSACILGCHDDTQKRFVQTSFNAFPFERGDPPSSRARCSLCESLPLRWNYRVGR